MISTALVVDGGLSLSHDSRMLGNRIKELREERGWSLEELARRANTSNQQISRLEKSQRRITAEWMYRLADALEVHPMEILEPPPPEKEKAAIKIFRQLDEPAQDAFLQSADAIAKLSSQRNSEKTSSLDKSSKAGRGGER